ncbi:hypothetical protein [Jeotgalicoccus sp. WY2]|uniref:hypothetical protein n=1 Tax=Jeotgalicoccus sp. WY2 TaxID=2708346 RepID=UPI00353022B9
MRIGITVAKMLAKQLNVPVYSVSSLFVLAVSNHVYRKYCAAYRCEKRMFTVHCTISKKMIY